jgi:RNA polymerase sigma-70 factor, ECF subfamily
MVAAVANPEAAPLVEDALLAALRSGSEAAFRELVMRHQRAMLRLAEAYTPSRAVAEEVVQEAWLAVLSGLDRFEGRSSLKTWIFRILVNRAKSRGVREQRSVPFSSIPRDTSEEEGPAVSPDRFLGDGHRWAGHWARPPEPWSDVPATTAVDSETRAVIEATIAALPIQQRRVITLRDVEGWTSEEVCDLLELSEGNQRVLLHRARSRVRAALERHFQESG